VKFAKRAIAAVCLGALGYFAQTMSEQEFAHAMSCAAAGFISWHLTEMIIKG
jgi:hypothetical protein